jgi:hypothetical protein
VGDVVKTTCEGACTSRNGLRVRSLTGQPSLSVEERDCKCCTGIGDWEQQLVLCDKSGTQVVEIMVYKMCGCLTCSGASEPIPLK